MPEGKEKAPAASAAAAAAAKTEVSGSKKVEGKEGVIPAAETAGAETAGGTVRLRDPEPVADEASGEDKAAELAGGPLDPGPDESLTNEPIEVRGRLVNPKPEQLGAVGELDPKGRSPEEFRLDQLKRERRRQSRRRSQRAERRAAAASAAEAEAEVEA